MALTCLDIITDAMREIGVLAVGREPKAAEAELGLLRLQGVIDGILGYGVGKSLTDVDVTGTATLTADSRNLLNLASTATLTLPETPSNGDRVEIIDVAGNLASHPVTIAPNGRTIEGGSSATLNTNGLTRSWVYANGNWALIADLSFTDELALGDDEFFTLELAKRLCPTYGVQFRPESQMVLNRAANRIRSRFSYSVVTPADDGVRFLSRQTYRNGLLDTDQ